MRKFASRLLAIAMLAGCGASQTPPDAPAKSLDAGAPAAAISIDAAVAATDAATDAAVDATHAELPARPRTVVGDLGVDVVLPPNARIEIRSSDTADIYLTQACPHSWGDELAPDFCVSATLSRTNGSAPTTLEAATAAWAASDGHERHSENWGAGRSDTGVFYLMRSFDVRVGFSSHGRNVHTFKTVSRVYGVLPIGDSAQVSCTGYLEHGVQSAEDDQLRALRDLCASLRARR